MAGSAIRDMSRNSRILFERILCPTDLTAESDDALRYAMALAEAYGAKLFVLHCVEAQPLPAYAYEANVEKHVEHSILRRFQENPAVDWEAVVVADDPVTAIPQEAARRGVDLIVMRSRRRPRAAAILGSTAESIFRTAPCPVLVTHPDERAWADGPSARLSLGKVLVAHDFSDCSELALINGLSLAQEYQAQLHLIHVLQSPQPGEGYENERSPESAFQQAARRLDNSISAEVRLWCDFKVAIREVRPYREILTYAEEEAIDLICMGVRGTGFGMKALFGSNADRVLRQAPCPVLIARPLKPAAAQWAESNGGPE
jgi:nucleotide-binding universal stress UspA family protein